MEHISIDKLTLKFKKKQIAALLKKPFWFPETEAEKVHKIGMSGHFDQTVGDRNKVLGIYVSNTFKDSTLKVKVKYKHLIYNSGGDGYPAMFYPSEAEYYFLINQTGEIERYKNEISQEEEASYLYLDLDALEVQEKKKKETKEEGGKSIQVTRDKICSKMRNQFKKELHDIKFLIQKEIENEKCNEDDLKKLKKEKSSIEKKLVASGEVKTKFFYNPYIYKTYGDYIIGGFTKAELDNIIISGDDSDLSFSKIKHLVKDRISNAIQNEKNEIRKNLRSIDRKIDQEELENTIKENMVEEIINYFGYTSYECQTWHDDPYLIITNSSNYDYWLSNIEERIVEYKKRSDYSIYDVNENIPSDVDIQQAEECTKTATFIEILEQLAKD